MTAYGSQPNLRAVPKGDITGVKIKLGEIKELRQLPGQQASV